MRLAALGFALCAASFAQAQVPNFPQTLPASTVVGRLGISAGPSQAIPFATLAAQLAGGNTVSSLGNYSGDGTLTFIGTGSNPYTGAVTIKCTVATASQIGCLEPDASTILISGGVISVATALPNLVTVGTIGTGTWHGTVIGATYGGTGVNNGSSTITLGASLTTTGTGAPTLAFSSSPFTYTFQAGSDVMVMRASADTLTNKSLTSSTDVFGGVTMTLGSDATGDIYYRSSSGVLTRLAIGSTGNVLKVSSGLPSWGTAAGAPCTTTASSLQYDAAGSFGCVAGWTSDATDLIGSTTAHLQWNSDTYMQRDAAEIVAHVNGTNANGLRVYNTSSSANANYERAAFDWTTTANLLTVGPQHAGTGSARDINIVSETGNFRLNYGVSTGAFLNFYNGTTNEGYVAVDTGGSGYFHVPSGTFTVTATGVNFSYLSSAGLVQTDASGNLSSNHTVSAATSAPAFAADHRIAVNFGGTTYNIPVSTVAW